MSQRDCQTDAKNINNIDIPTLCNQIHPFQRGPACASGALNFNVPHIQQNSPCGTSQGCWDSTSNIQLQTSCNRALSQEFAPFQQMPVNIHNIPKNNFLVNQNPNLFNGLNNQNIDFINGNSNIKNCGVNSNTDGCNNNGGFSSTTNSNICSTGRNGNYRDCGMCTYDGSCRGVDLKRRNVNSRRPYSNALAAKNVN